jgi:hypothetical protein
VQYILLIYSDERAWTAFTEEERGAVFRDYFALIDDLRAAGAYVAGSPLRDTETASTIRVRDGETVVTEGPFAETKEQLGGFLLVEAGSDEEVREWGARIPAARYGSVEVRPVLQLSPEMVAGIKRSP